MKAIAFLILFVAAGCTESGPHKGHAGAQASQAPVLHEAAGADRSTTNFKNSIVYGDTYSPRRNFESSVLNEPDEGAQNDAKGRGYRVNGAGYGFER